MDEASTHGEVFIVVFIGFVKVQKELVLQNSFTLFNKDFLAHFFIELLIELDHGLCDRDGFIKEGV